MAWPWAQAETEQTFDLCRMLKPKPPLWEILPFGDVALQAALLSCVTMFLSHKEASAHHAHIRITTETSKHAWMKKFDDAKLDQERKDLEARVAAVKEFLETRMRWTEYTRDAAARLPEEVVLRSFVAFNELQTGKMKGKKSLVLKLSTPITGGKSMPHEIDDFLARCVVIRSCGATSRAWNSPTSPGAKRA